MVHPGHAVTSLLIGLDQQPDGVTSPRMRPNALMSFYCWDDFLCYDKPLLCFLFIYFSSEENVFS